MTHAVVWDEYAINAAALFLDDPEGLRSLLDAVDALAHDPRPTAAAELGGRDLLRLRVGRYRVMYEITSTAATVTVIHVGRTG